MSDRHDDDGAPAAKRRRPEKLIDDIAEDEDDPDADDEDFDIDNPDDLDDPDLIAAEDDDAADPSQPRRPGKARMPRGATIEEDDTMHLTLDQRREQEEAERLVRELDERYGGEDGAEDIDLNDMDDYDEYDMEGGTGGGVAIPSIKDPKLWLIRCDPGTEDLMCLTLLQRYANKQGSDDPLFIHSAFTTPASKGYIYVEADKEVHVKRAIRGLRAIKWWKMQLLPITQMVSAVKFTDDVPTIRVGQWVRVKSGVYRGDVGQVYQLTDQNTNVTVKLVPRVDYTAISEQMRTGAKRRRPPTYSAADRPAATLFSEAELREKCGSEAVKSLLQTQKHPRDHKMYHFLGTQRFRHGFTYKDMKFTGLYIDNIQPTADELDRFQTRARDDDLDYDASDDIEAIQPTATSNGRSATSTQLAIGDHVIVSSGAMKNITGRITSLNKQHVTLQPDSNQPIAMPLDLMLKEIKKFFRLGDHVKVVGGVYRDETGMVTQVLVGSDELSVYSDTGLREIVVSTQDVIESSEVSSGRESLGNFQMYDMVQLNDQTVAVITKVEVASFRVITQRGTTMTVKLQEIGRRRNSKFAAALDGASNQVGKDDVVTVNSGEHRGKQGTIRHIYRHFLFLFSRSVIDNAGIFVVPAKQATLVGQYFRTKPAAIPQSPHVGGGGEGGTEADTKLMGPPAARGGMQRRMGDRHPMLGKTVVITGGPYKSFMGIVIDVTELNVKVELHALARKVIVNIGEVREKSSMTPSTAASASSSSRDYFLSSQTPLLGNRTPAYELGSQTPAHDAFAGSQTPAYGASTPSREAWSAQTPARSWSEGGEGEGEDEVGEEWRQDYHMTPVPHTPSNVKTPNARLDDDDDEEKEEDKSSHGRRVPRTPITPATPMTRVPLTPAPHDDYATPHTPMQQRRDETTDDDDSAAAATTTTLPVGARILTADGTPGVVTQRTADGGVRLQLDGKGVVQIGRGAVGALQRVAPEKGDTVVVVSGEVFVGQLGSVIGINQNSGECILNLGGDIEVLSTSVLCKYEKPKA